MDKGGEWLSQCGHFADKGEEVNLSQFVRTSFVDVPYYPQTCCCEIYLLAIPQLIMHHCNINVFIAIW